MSTINNGIKEFISSEQGPFMFKPSSQFYDEVYIKRQRWGHLYRDEQSATIIEMQNIAKYFTAKFNYSINKNKTQTK